MKRKKWTLQEDVTDALLKVREKKKWQLALRRYIVEKQPTPQYAPYFGLPTDLYRQWIELQFTGDLNWDNFGKAWQFDHIVPVIYFDYSIKEELKLCWSFINIRVESLELNKGKGKRVDILAAKAYFEHLYTKTHFGLCRKMINKIATVEVSNTESEPGIEQFIIENTALLNAIDDLEADEFNQLNDGVELNQLLLEREILKKFGT